MKKVGTYIGFCVTALLVLLASCSDVAEESKAATATGGGYNNQRTAFAWR